jgi:prepilin peptidase CpaA
MLSALAAAALTAAAWCDIRARLIPNALPIVVSSLAIANGVVHGGLALATAVALVFFALGFVAFAVGVAGGGDAKLLAAVGLWIPPAALSDFFTIMALTGALLALVVVAGRRLVAVVTGEAVAEPASVPYGAAIAAGAGYVLLAPV